MMNKPELLSPAGSAPAMVAAVQSGADAVYLGAGDFNARRNADNFGGELDAAVAYCHARGVRTYVTLNTMVRQDELARLEKTIAEICDAGADAVIVQDFGVARTVRQMAPTLHLHASTQMAVHNRQGVSFLKEQGFSRIVLAREMEYAEIARCAETGAELEVFVHGALCVACSGQCLMSSIIGGRSGNRGLCAQPCRMRYRMGRHEGHLLSTRDLCSLEALPELIAAGAGSLKIEGRLKRPEYVALTTSIFREAIDAAASGKAFDTAAAKRELAQMFNRGAFTRGYGFGVEDRELIYAPRPNHLGVVIGRCVKNGAVELNENTDAGDTLVLRRGRDSDIPLHTGAMHMPAAPCPEARKGDALVRLVSQRQMQQLHDRYFGEFMNIPVDADLTLRVGQKAVLTLSDGQNTRSAEGSVVEAAQSRPANPERIRAQIEKLGDTPFAVRNYRCALDENAYLPVSALNALRRTAAEALLEARFGEKHACGAPAYENIPVRALEKPVLAVQSADPAQLGAALKNGADLAVFDPDDLRRSALDAALEQLPATFGLAVNAVCAQDTLERLNRWANDHADRISHTFLSNIGHAGLNWPGEKIGDAPLNIANSASVAQLADWGISAYTPSVELKCAQIDALGGRKYLTVYGALTLMYLRHCPLRAHEKMPGLHKHCRRCDSAADSICTYSLTDRMNASFPLRRTASDEGCVIRVLNSAKLMLLKKATALPACEGWRLILDNDDDASSLTQLHRKCIDGENFRGDVYWAILENMNTTTGHYFRGVE